MNLRRQGCGFVKEPLGPQIWRLQRRKFYRNNNLQLCKNFYVWVLRCLIMCLGLWYHIYCLCSLCCCLSAHSCLPISEKVVSVPHFSIFLFLITAYKINNFCSASCLLQPCPTLTPRLPISRICYLSCVITSIRYKRTHHTHTRGKTFQYRSRNISRKLVRE